jgi:hypothetical protein
MAARAALRVLPLIGRELKSGKRRQDEILATFILAPLRAASVSWVAAKYPAHGDELRIVAFSVAFDAFARTGAGDDAAHHAARTTTAAFVTIEAADAIHAAVEAAAAARIAALSATNNILAVENLLAVPDVFSLGKDDDVVAADTADAAQIDSGRSAAELVGTPLWRNGAPNWAAVAWRDLKSALLAAGGDWDVWIDWYEARLAGDAARPPNEALEIARATIPDEIWQQGPAAVNAEIKRLIDEHTPKSTVSIAIQGVEARASAGEIVATIAAPLQGAEARASAGEFVPNPAPPPAGWMNAGDDPAVQLAAQTRLQARAASEMASITQPPFPQSQVPSAGTAPQFIGGTTPPTNLPPIETIPLQERAATQFRADAQGRIDVVQIPPATDELQRLHYDEMRHKAAVLVALGQMLGDVAWPAKRILEALPERMEDASVDKLWSRANTLRRRHDAHLHAIDNELGPDPARLDALVAASLGDFVESFNVYVLGDPRALELDSARLGPQDREAVRRIVSLAAPIARAASESQAPTTPAAQAALAEQVEGAIDAPDDLNGDQAADLARKTMGNFVSELLRWAYAPIAKLGGGIRKEAMFALKEFRSGLYRAPGTAAFAGLSVTAYAYWPEISAFVVRNADALKDFVTALFNNPKLVEIIDLIVHATKHLG